jgi:UDP-GlcNAc:undecaprenyl-phosphate GlcNAc-1-phosphate transferase
VTNFIEIYFQNLHNISILNLFMLFISSLILCLLIILFNPEKFLRKRSNSDLTAVQRAHLKPVPRLGGLALFLGMFLIFPMAEALNLDTSGLWRFIVSLIPIFLIGTAEDLGFYMSPLRRLIAICLASVLMIASYGCWVPSVGIPYVDALISFAPFGIIFTVFAAAGVTNSFNLIDGLNGLAAFTAMSVSISLSIVAAQANHSDLSILCLAVVPVVAGFFVLNFPFGKIFLGDGGAYLLGHTLVWVSIYLMDFDQSISPFAILLIFFWPVADTFLAIWRRKTLGKPRHKPDRLHFHQLVMRFLEIRGFGRSRRAITNPLATLLLMPLIVTPQILGIIFAKDGPMATISLVGLGILFIATYLIGISIAKKRGVP